jgi:transcriptional regulator with XRE-family HTH domain
MKLREARARKLLTVQSLAQLAGVSASTINKIEQGAWLPSLKTIRKLADVLKVEPSDVEEFKAAIEKSAGN